MKLLNYLKLDLFSIISLGIFNFLILTNNSSLFRELFTLVFIFTIPGMLLTHLLKLTVKNLWEYGLYCIALSTSFLLIAGLSANFLLLVFSITKPLTLLPLIYFFNVVIGLLILLHSILPKNRGMHILLSHISFIDSVLIACSTFLPLLSIFGAISLNNGGSNILTMILLCLIPLLLICLIALENKLQEHTYYAFIVASSISLLLMLSLRSWHISGSDINEEFRIFQITKHMGFWNPYFSHAYNACISLTIVPTILSLFTKIQDEYIYKVVFQILFSLTPLALYTLYRNFTNKSISLLAVFYVIAQPFFIQPMTALIRQEVALFFFTLSLMVVFSRTLKKITANILFILFGMSMIVSHYSTSYISIGLFISSYVAIASLATIKEHVLVKKIIGSIRSFRFNVHLTHSIQAVPLLILIAFTYFWFFQFTQTSGNLTGVMTATIANLSHIGKEKKTTVESAKALSLFSAADTSTFENINKYVKKETSSFENSSIAKYAINPRDIPLYPISVLSVPPLYKSYWNIYLNNFLSIIKLITKVIVFLGPLVLIIRYFHRDTLDKEYIILTLVGIGIVGLVIIHPTLGEAYNLSRVYLQILFIASLGGILFITDIIPKINQTVKYTIVSVLFSLMFILFSGVSAEVIGGTAFLHLHNYGDDYDKFYTHDQEVKSAQWLSSHYDTNQFIFTDEISNLRLQSFGNITSAFPIVLPSAMYKNSYVYVRFANIARLRTDVSANGINILYSFPIDFLNKNKNLIYNNGGSSIYR